MQLKIINMKWVRLAIAAIAITETVIGGYLLRPFYVQDVSYTFPLNAFLMGLLLVAFGGYCAAIATIGWRGMERRINPRPHGTLNPSDSARPRT